MTPFASVALFKRNGTIVFKAPRKEASADKTQARKSASRFWNGSISEPDKLTKLVLVHCISGPGGNLILVCERQPGRDWLEYHISHGGASQQPHLAACLAELGVDPAKTAPAMPDVLEINGVIYRREI